MTSWLAGLPRHPWLAGPTPVEPLCLPGVAEGALFVKRDDQCCPVYGGNKPRKLEFVIGLAKQRGSRRLVTTGGLGTHHGLATTVLAREVGIATTVVCVGQPITDHVRQVVRDLGAFGAEIRYGNTVAGAAGHVAWVLLRSFCRGERPMLVPPGGTSALSTIGYVLAALELAEQVRRGLLPEPEEIFVPVGTGGTLAGLVLGAKLAQLRSRVVGVMVTDILPPSPGRLARLARACSRQLKKVGGLPAPVSVRPDDFVLTYDQLGAGYGAVTEAGERAIELAGGAGLALETTYTAKCLAEMVARARRGELGQPALFWCTVHQGDLQSRWPGDTSRELPDRIGRLLELSAR